MDPHKNLQAYLRLHLAGEIGDLEGLDITSRQTDTAGGCQLKTRFVSRLEVETALVELHRINWLGSNVLRLRLTADSDGRYPSWRDVARRLRQSYTTVMDEYDRALSWMVSRIYDWTPGGQALAAVAEQERERATCERNR